WSYGSVYVWVRPPDGWLSTTESARLVASDGHFDYNMGRSVAIESDTVVVGVPEADIGPDADQGAAYVFMAPPGGWVGTLTETAKLLVADGQEWDALGSDVAVRGDTVVVGANQYYAEAPGAAYIFLEPSGGWAGALTETAQLLASDGQPDDRFGEEVALSSDTIAVGAPGWGSPMGGLTQGAAYIFVEPPGGWTSTLTETSVLTGFDGYPPDNDLFGAAVALANDTLVVGAPYAEAPTPAEDEGLVYLFVDDTPRAPLLDLAYTYYASSGDNGTGIFRLYDDGTFVTDTGASGVWAYQPAQRRFLFQFDPGHFCDAFFLGRVQGATVRGVYNCGDGSGGGLWVGTLSLPLAQVPAPPLGKA
ncbi:MAG: hypothetical protein ACRDIB_06665, partial [Ardenticatenaceae bacterium]